LVRRLRKTASAASTTAAINSAPPMAIAPLRSEPEFSGGGTIGFVGATRLVGMVGTMFVGVTGVTFVGVTGAGFVRSGGAGGGGQLVSTFVPMMISGGLLGGLTTGAGGGVFVGAGAGGGGNSGKVTMPGGKFTVQPTYWPSCVRNTRTNGCRVRFCSACRC
jgi:hypothetical protein